jgi:hypothetical protein
MYVRRESHARIFLLFDAYCYPVCCCSLEEILANTTFLNVKLDFTNSMQLQATGEDVDVIARWCHEQTSRALVSLKTPTNGDVPIIMSILLEKGLAFLPDVYVFFSSTFLDVHRFA